MAIAPESTVPAQQVAFEPDDVTFADNRVTVTGRWSGVRGRRFVRPTLTLVGDGASSRMLAELEHKPWAAEDGAPWTAAFACAPESGGADEVELAVAPDIAVVLPAPEPLKSRPRRPKRHGRPRRGTSAQGSAAAEPPPTAARSQNRNTTARAKIEKQQAEIARLQEKVGRNELARAEWRAAMSRRDAAVAKLDAVVEERDAVAAERDTALAQRDAAVADRDTARSERDAAISERDAAISERDATTRARDAAISRRDVAVGALDTAVSDRERLVRERDAFEQESTALKRRRRELERAQSDLRHERDRLAADLEEARAAVAAVAAGAADVTPPVPASPAVPSSAVVRAAPGVARDLIALPAARGDRHEPATRIRAADIPAPSPTAFAEPMVRLPAVALSQRFRRGPAARDAQRGPVALWAARAAALAVLLAMLIALVLVLQSV